MQHFTVPTAPNIIILRKQLLVYIQILRIGYTGMRITGCNLLADRFTSPFDKPEFVWHTVDKLVDSINRAYIEIQTVFSQRAIHRYPGISPFYPFEGIQNSVYIDDAIFYDCLDWNLRLGFCLTGCLQSLDLQPQILCPLAYILVIFLQILLF